MFEYFGLVRVPGAISFLLHLQLHPQLSRAPRPILATLLAVVSLDRVRTGCAFFVCFFSCVLQVWLSALLQSIAGKALPLNDPSSLIKCCGGFAVH